MVGRALNDTLRHILAIDAVGSECFADGLTIFLKTYVARGDFFFRWTFSKYSSNKLRQQNEGQRKR